MSRYSSPAEPEEEEQTHCSLKLSALKGQTQPVPRVMLRLLTSTRKAADPARDWHVVAASTLDTRARSPRRTAALQRSVWSCWVLNHVDHSLNDSGREVIATSLDLN